MRLLSVIAVAAAFLIPAAQAQVTKDTVPGIRNLARVETTVACAGAVTPSAVGEIKKMGFVSIINLRLPSEQGADIEGETAAAKTAGIKFFSIPFDNAKMDPAVVDQFLQTIRQPGNQPAFIHCASGNRAAGMWLVKRVLVDKWDVDKASEEAAGLGLTSQPLKTFMLDYIKAHSR